MALLDTTAAPSPQGWAVASGVLLAALLKKLVANGKLSPTEAGEIIRDARAGLDQFGSHYAHHDAASFLDILSEKFPA
jgi:hypothetical protein